MAHAFDTMATMRIRNERTLREAERGTTRRGRRTFLFGPLVGQWPAPAGAVPHRPRARR